MGTLRIPINGGVGVELLSNSEPWLDRILEPVLAIRHGAFLDVGVNIGQTLVKVHKAGSARRYWGFEPNPSAAAYVRSLVALNGLENVHLICAALGDRDGVARLHLSNVHDSCASIVEGFRTPDFYRTACNVLLIDGNRFVEKMSIDAIAVLKIDVEGGELEVLRGLNRTIMRSRPLIICEVLPVYDENSQVGQFRRKRSDELVSLVLSMNYRIFRIDADGCQTPLDSIETHGNMALTNYLFVPGEEA